MRRLIVNADDFGLSQAVNAGILEAHFRGIVTSTTVLANGAAFGGVASLPRRAPRLGVGVHLNLTGGDPVSPAARVPTLVDSCGRLYLSPSRLLWALWRRRTSLAEIEIELRAQIGKVCGTGLRPTHLDGHKHVHVLPGIAEIVIRLAKEFGIPSIRCPKEIARDPSSLYQGRKPTTAVLRQYLVGRAVSAFGSRFAEQCSRAGLWFPKAFYGLSQTGFLDVHGVLEILGGLSEGVSELMCHPGFVDADLVDSGTRLLGQRTLEVQAMTARVVTKFIADHGKDLVSYEVVKGPVAAECDQLETVEDRRLVI